MQQTLETPNGLRFELFYGATQLWRSFTPPRRFEGFVTGDQGMGHVVVFVADPPTEEEFLKSVLGFGWTDTVVTPIGSINFFHINTRHHSIACVPGVGEPKLHHVMLQVNDFDDVGVAYDRVHARDDLPVTMTLGRHATDRMVSFYVRTPTGFEVEYGYGALQLTDRWTPTKSVAPTEIWGHEMAH